MLNLQKLKKKKVSDTLKYQLKIFDKNGSEIGNLIPIGEWAIKDIHLIKNFAQWRKKFMKFFFSQFESSSKSTKSYLKNLSIYQKNRIFFAIYTSKKLIGHIGLKNISASRAELDNIIRGKSGGHPDLMYFAEKKLLEWAFKTLKVKSIVAEVMSKNILALSLHRRFGFTHKKSFFLKKVKNKKLIKFEYCSKKDSTEIFFSYIAELKSNKFSN